jgi:hypothetical protein
MSEQPDRLHWIELENEVEHAPEVAAPAKPAAPDPRIDDYLDHVYAPLVSVVPYAQRQELKAELRAHLETLGASYEELGSTPDAAVGLALRQFGDPQDLSREWAREWHRAMSPTPIEPAWRSTKRALGWFGPATLLACVMSGIVTAFCIGRLEGSAPNPFVLLALINGLIPIAAGIAAGRRSPARPALGAFFALAALFVPMSGVSLLLLRSSGDGLIWDLLSDLGLLVCLQTLFWLPIGCAAAALGGWLRDRSAPKPFPWVLQ